MKYPYRRHHFILIVALFQALITFKVSAESSNLNTRESLLLNGEWQLVLNEFLDYKQVLKDTSSIATTVPGTWNDLMWHGEPFSGTGFGTYYKKVTIDDKKNRLAIDMPVVGLSYELYINEELLGGQGRIAQKKEEAAPYLKPSFFEFIPSQNEIYIIVHVSNFHHQNGGIWFAPTIGNASLLKEKKSRKATIDLFILGSIFMMGLYWLYIYYKRPKLKYGFYFFMVCICLLSQSLSKGDIHLMSLFPNMHWELLKKFEYISLFTVGMFNMLFVRELFPELISKKATSALVYLSSTVSVASIFLPARFNYIFIAPFQLISLAVGIYLVIVLIKAVRNNYHGAKSYLIGLGITFLTAVNDILNAHYLIDTPLIVHYGMFVYTVSLAIVLASRYISAFRQEEILTKRLSIANKNLEARVEERAVELKLKSEEQDQLTAIVAHDLKSPLSSIIGLSNLLKDNVTEEGKKMNEMIQQIATQGIDLIKNLVELKSYEDEGFEVNTDTFKLSDFFEEVLIRHQEKADQKEIKIIADSMVSEINFSTDKSLLQRIFDNLISNAIKFSPREKKIRLTASSSNDIVKFTVEDEGQGFTDDDRKKLFRKFQKLSARPTGGESSTGLGLSIVKNLIEKLSGSIRLDTEIGKGSKFSFWLPNL